MKTIRNIVLITLFSIFYCQESHGQLGVGVPPPPLPARLVHSRPRIPQTELQAIIMSYNEGIYEKEHALEIQET